MDLTDLPAWRLRQQCLWGEPLPSAPDVVRWSGAVQAQDYAGAKWAVGQRTRGVTDAGLDHLFNAGAILRTHVLRPTWHFVLPEDAHWLLQLTGPRLRSRLRGRHRQLELTDPEIARATDVLAEALVGGRSLTRAELGSRLQTAGIAPHGQRLPHLLLCAELDALIVSGPLRGKQFTWTLFEERAPKSRPLDREELAVRLACRYFQGHGPALLHDFTWWSGLTLAEARQAVAAAGSALEAVEFGGRTYCLASHHPSGNELGLSPRAHLLPNWDEYTVGYRDRSAIVRSSDADQIARLPFGSVLANVVTLDGRVRGGWTRKIGRDVVEVLVHPLGAFSAPDVEAIHQAARRLGWFLGRPARVHMLDASAARPVARG